VIIYGTVAGMLALVAIGFVLIPVILLLNFVFCVIAAVKASNGETWSYPITYNLL